MPQSPAGSEALFGFALVCISLVVLLVLRHYLPLRTTAAYLLIPVFLALALPSSIILLVPIDLASNAVDDDGVARGIWLPETVMLAIWRIAYWLTFTLTWLVLPLLGEYADSGNREPIDRLKYSIRNNARYQLILLSCGIAGLIYMVISYGFNFRNLKATVVAIAYAWGLILAIYLMGHGLVTIPRRLFRGASINGRLRQLQSEAPRIHERMTESIEDLDQLEAQVLQLRQRKTGTAKSFQEWIDDLADTSDLPESRISSAPSTRVGVPQVPPVITERYLADLTRKLKRARHKRIRFIEEWDHIIKDAADCQAILDAKSSKSLDFGRPASSNTILARFTLLTPLTRYYLYANILPTLRLVLSAFLALASFCIIWSEVFAQHFTSLSLVGLSIVHHPRATDKGKIGFAGQLVAGAWLLYMCTAALASFREVRVWGNRALVRRHTYAESACWYASYVARLTVPLSFNFITFLPDAIYTNTAFYHFFGALIDLSPLGSQFSRFFPILILIPVAATSFNLYGRFRRITGFADVFDDASPDNPNGYGTSGWREGKALIDRERLTAGSGSGSASPALGLASRTASPRRTTIPTKRIDTAIAPRPRYADSPTASAAAEEDEDGGFFDRFAHRVRNTLDTVEPPKFSIPKWMGGERERGAEPSGLGRFFGGSRGNGEVRL